MKMQNVYIGQKMDPRHSAVYTSIDEAVKELLRPHQPGMVFDITFLPDAERYWFAGVVDNKAQRPETKWNNIFTDSASAEKHAEMLLARGWSKASVLVKELKPVSKGPKNIDIKTPEHFQCERALRTMHDALANGIPADNHSSRMTLELVDSALAIKGNFAVIDLDAEAWTNPADAKIAYAHIKTAAKLLRELALVDPETQPKKFARLQAEARDFSALPFDPELGE